MKENLGCTFDMDLLDSVKRLLDGTKNMVFSLSPRSGAGKIRGYAVIVKDGGSGFKVTFLLTVTPPDVAGHSAFWQERFENLEQMVERAEELVEEY